MDFSCFQTFSIDPSDKCQNTKNCWHNIYKQDTFKGDSNPNEKYVL